MMSVTDIRNLHPALSSTIYLNTGTAGPLSERVIQRMKEALDEQMRAGRINMAYYQKLEALKTGTRELIAGLVSCSPSEISLTRSTSEGLNIVINGLQLLPGEELITTNAEHLTVYSPAWSLKKKGVSVKLLNVLDGFDSCLEQLKSLISEKTRLICISHVLYCSGDKLPVRAICDLGREKSIPVLIDGAQSFGAMPVNVKELGCDFYSAPGQKWICGPEGSGFLYSAGEAREMLDPLFTGYGSVRSFDFNAGLELHEDGRKFESGTYQPADLAGFNEALKWISSLDLKETYARSMELCRLFRDSLSGHPGISFVNHELSSPLIAFKIKNTAAEKAVQRLSERGITVRPVPITDAVRLSVGFFNTEEEIRKVAEEVLEMAGKG